MHMQKERITATLDSELVIRLDRLAELRDHSRSKMMEYLLGSAIEEEEANMKKLASPVIGPIVQSILDHPKLMNSLAALIGDQLSPEEIVEWQNAAPKIRRTRERLQDERGRRHDLDVETT
jgi:hypothetical protein